MTFRFNKFVIVAPSTSTTAHDNYNEINEVWVCDFVYFPRDMHLQPTGVHLKCEPESRNASQMTKLLASGVRNYINSPTPHNKGPLAEHNEC